MNMRQRKRRVLSMAPIRVVVTSTGELWIDLFQSCPCDDCRAVRRARRAIKWRRR